jgi:regulator of nonsense transcripts 2
MFFSRGAAGKKLDYFLSFFQYYIHTKSPLPMDIEFVVQDIFALTRPQWKLANNFEEAMQAFQLAIEQDQKTSGLSKTVEPDDVSGSSSSGDDGAVDQDDDDEYEVDDIDLPEQENDQNLSPVRSDSEEEHIVVKKQEQEVDLEYEADFEREYAKMMAESLESRKAERKPHFDAPLPVRARNRDHNVGIENGERSPNSPGPTMAFSLLTKKGNRQQVHIFLHFQIFLLFEPPVDRNHRQKLLSCRPILILPLR